MPRDANIGRGFFGLVAVLLGMVLLPNLSTRMFIISVFQRSLNVAKADLRHKFEQRITSSSPNEQNSRYEAYGLVKELVSYDSARRSLATANLKTSYGIQLPPEGEDSLADVFYYRAENSPNFDFDRATQAAETKKFYGSLGALYGEIFRRNQLFHCNSDTEEFFAQPQDSTTVRQAIHCLHVPLYCYLLTQLESGERPIAALRYCMTCAEDDDILNDFEHQFGSSQLRSLSLNAIVDNFQTLDQPELGKLNQLLQLVNLGNFDEFLNKLKIRVGKEELRELNSRSDSIIKTAVYWSVIPILIAKEWLSAEHFISWCRSHQDMNFAEFKDQSDAKFKAFQPNSVAYFFLEGFPNPAWRLAGIHNNKLTKILLLRAIYCRKNVDQLKSLQSTELRATLQKQFPLPKAIRYADNQFSVKKTEDQVELRSLKFLGSKLTNTIKIPIR